MKRCIKCGSEIINGINGCEILNECFLTSESKGETVYYVHMDGFPNIPVFGSIGTKAKANKICRQYNADGKLYKD